MSERNDWESVMFHIHQDRQLLQVQEAFVDLLSGHTARYNALDPFNSGFFGHDFGNVYVDDDDCTDDDSDYEDRRHKNEFCGFTRNFLDHGSPRSRSPHPPHPPYRTGLQQIMHEQAEKNAKELVEEEERLKVKTETKRLKKLRRKERKRKEKEKEQKDADKNKDREVESKIKLKSKFSNGECVNENSHKAAASIPADTAAAVPLKKTQAGATSAQNKPNSNGPSEDEEEDEDEEEEDSEVESIASELEVLDMDSCFVSKAATIAKRKMELKAKSEKREEKNRSSRKQEPKQQQHEQPQQLYGQRQLAEPHPRGVEPQQQQSPRQQQQQPPKTEVASIEDVLKRSTELAVIGNQLGNSGRFDMAVTYFTDAIKHNPKDYRLFGNRSFCYEKMQQCEKALIDADISLAMSPGWIRGLYRRGRALAGLKRYSEAAAAFKNVLQQDSTSSDAAQELMRVQIMQLMEMGFSREQSSNALIIHGTVEKALEAFSNIQDEKFGSSNPPVANARQSAEEGWVVAGQKAQAPANQAPMPQTLPPAKPQHLSNHRPAVKTIHAKTVTPEHFPLWVGNVVPSVTEAMVDKLFGSVGPIHSIKMLPSGRCAFINYKRRGDCDTAIAKFHGVELHGSVLYVRYPNRIHPHLGASKSAKQFTELPPEAVERSTPTMPGECVFWRNSGCIKQERCSYKHIPDHKGIDRGRDKLAP